VKFTFYKAQERTNARSFHISPARSSLKLLKFKHIQLRRGQSCRVVVREQECLITLLQGNAEVVHCGISHKLGPRKDVFCSASHSFFCSGKGDVVVKAQCASELIIAMVPCRTKHPARLIRPSDVRKRCVGKGTYQRVVHDILKEEDPIHRLIAGETFNKPGKWSSFPPHKHDCDRLPHESKLEEVYFFKVKPANRFGMIRLYGVQNGKLYDQPFVIQNNDCVIIPFGYHPVCAAPDTELYYFWVLAGEKRKLRCSVDVNYL
jgi:5-deoxy-glucuronate isomerase